MDMKEWKELIESSVDSAREGHPDQLDLLARALDEAERAKQLLRNKGYGWTGLSLLETVKEEVPSILEI